MLFIKLFYPAQAKQYLLKRLHIQNEFRLANLFDYFCSLKLGNIKSKFMSILKTLRETKRKRFSTAKYSIFNIFSMFNSRVKPWK